MKKGIKWLLTGSMALSLMACSSSSGDKETLRVYNWGEYIDQSVLDDFEDEYNCEIIYETYDSNEVMYTKLSAGGNSYDILVPSDYMIDQLIQEDLIQKIDWSLITNADNLNSDLMNQSFDPDNEYWVSYFCGNVGIVYDKTKVDEEDLEEGWEVLCNTKYAGDIYMYDSVRDSFMVALKALGYSCNTTDEDEINEAYDWLIDQKNTMDPIYVGDTVIDSMVNSEKAMAVVYSGDAAYILSENEDMGFYLPEEGTNYWFDGFVITKDCENVELAHEFINYMCEIDVALSNTYEVGYLTSVTEAADEAADDIYEGNEAYTIRMDENDEVFVCLDTDTKSLYNTLWTKVLSD